MKNLEKALVGASNKHSFYGNDTGFADFLGAVEPKDIENQQKVSLLKKYQLKQASQLIQLFT